MSVHAIKGFKCLHKMIAYIKGSLWVHKSEWSQINALIIKPSRYIILKITRGLHTGTAAQGISLIRVWKSHAWIQPGLRCLRLKAWWGNMSWLPWGRPTRWRRAMGDREWAPGGRAIEAGPGRSRDGQMHSATGGTEGSAGVGTAFMKDELRVLTRPPGDCVVIIGPFILVTSYGSGSNRDIILSSFRRFTNTESPGWMLEALIWRLESL